MKAKDTKHTHELQQLCATVRDLIAECAYERCAQLICAAMEQYPHAPQPHNLMGIVLEKTGDHTAAMKHFRAAWALDPTYAPVAHNLHTYGTFHSHGVCAFDESDLPPASRNTVQILYDQRGVGCVVSTITTHFDAHGIGHIVRG